METYVHACIAGKLLFLCNFSPHYSIFTTLLCKILFTKSKNIYLFSFYSTKCPGRFTFKSDKWDNPVDFTVFILHGGAVKQAA